jgi:hypothetical protein
MTSFALLLFAMVQDGDAARAAVERSLLFLEKEGAAWIRRRDCLSCHHIPFLLWTHQEARAKGIAVDAARVDGWKEWARQESAAQRIQVWLTGPIDGLPPETSAKLAPFWTKPELKGGMKESAFLSHLGKMLSAEEASTHRAEILKRAARGKGDGGGVDTMAQLLLSGVADEAFAESTRAHLAGEQQPDGSWKPNGQLRGLNRAEGEAVALTTMWSVLALGPKSEAAAKGVAFVRNAPRGKTTEYLVTRSLVESHFGEEKASAGFLRELRQRQNADGGWGAVKDAASDAFATGLALYALGSTQDEAFHRGRKFLVGSQTDDGSWTVSAAAWTKPGSSPERNKRLDPIFRYWGTAWATLGLLR